MEIARALARALCRNVLARDLEKPLRPHRLPRGNRPQIKVRGAAAVGDDEVEAGGLEGADEHALGEAVLAGALVATAFAAWLFAPEERGYRAGDAGASRTLPDAG